MESRVSAVKSLLVAAFDLDHTLIKPHGKHKFSVDRDDVELWHPQVAKVLKKLQSDGYKIVIFTNQKGIGKNTSVEDIYYKIDTFLPNGADIDVYISYQDDGYRKPCPGMYDHFIENNGDPDEIFYVGDAAGRPSDFSSSDAQFAYNTGMEFYTPEQFFLGKEQDIPDIQFIKCPRGIPLKKDIPEKSVIILVGMPGSGKSTFTEQLIEKYNGLDELDGDDSGDAIDVVSNDIMGSAAKTHRAYLKLLAEGAKRILVDNTNATIINRAAFTEPAIDAGYNVFAIHLDVDYNVAMHLNHYRAYSQECDAIPEIAYRLFIKRFEPPTKAEGFTAVIKYVPNYDKEIFGYSLTTFTTF